KPLMRRMVVDTILSVILIAITAPFGLIWVAASRVVHGLLYIVIYAPLMRDILGMRWRDLASVTARSALATLAAVAPLLASYILWAPPAQTGFAQAFTMIGSGMALWLMTLQLTAHPLRDEILDLGTVALTRLRRPPVPAIR
ncbi:MAG: polysaccharide biosynthesis protein, partial [Novosphingobium sp.]|nr:polysaccharide biosynthesis protein [Novosphingobium sp.]